MGQAQAETLNLTIIMFSIGRAVWAEVVVQTMQRDLATILDFHLVQYIAKSVGDVTEPSMHTTVFQKWKWIWTIHDQAAGIYLYICFNHLFFPSFNSNSTNRYLPKVHF